MTKYTFSRNKGHHNNGGGSGWSREGKDKYNELFQAVMKDRRRKHWSTFNAELLKMYQQRRKMEGGRGSGQKKSIVQEINKKAFRCMDELNDMNDNMSDDDECNSDDEEEMNDKHEVGEGKYESTVVLYKNVNNKIQTEIDWNETSFKIEPV